MERYIIMDSNTKTTEEGFKECRICGKVKPLSEFYFRKDGKAHRSECKECIKAISRLRVTGWSPDDYERAWILQDGKCAICGCKLNSSRFTRAQADHDHKTGKLRGLLCINCNTSLGLMKDSPYRLESAIRYLEEHGCNV